jgi:PAS domain S-box-containing protein
MAEPPGRRDELDELTLAANRMLLGFRESRRQLVDKALVDNVLGALVDLLVVIDEQGRIVLANAACERLLGLTPEAFAGSQVARWLAPDEKAPDANPLDFIAAVVNGATGSIELAMVAQDGTHVPVHVLAAPLPQGIEGHARAVIVARDLRAKRADERQFQQVQAQLAQAAKLASLGTLGAGVAHELNNPLAAVRGYAELMSGSPDVGDKSRALAAKIIRASDRMRKIIDHLRIFSADTTRLDKRKLDLSTIVQDSLILLQNQIEGRGVAVEAELAAGLPALVGDGNQLESVIQNLIVNARDALEDVTDGRARRVRVRTYAADGGRSVAVQVEDNANGIPAHVQPRIFDPFFTTKGVGRGTGLGLSIAHGIAKDHGGELTFVTQAGIGTTFTVVLPVAGEAAAALASPPARAAPPPAPTAVRPVVVIIDDEPDVADVLAMYLEPLYRCERFVDGRAALERLVARPFDLLITDMRMPKLNGIELIRLLRARLPDAKVLVASGHASTESDIVLALAEGARGVISKPFPPREELFALLARTLGSASPGTLPTAG